MAFIVEDGTGVANANSYIDVAWADTYFTDRGNTDWTDASTSAKQVALIRATDYIDVTYVFIGIKASSEQGLEWPRSYAIDIYGEELTGIPTILKKAVAETAVRALAGELIEDFDSQGRIKRERVEGAVEVEYGGDGALQMKSFPYIDRLLMGSGLVESKNGSTGQRKIIRT